MKVCVIGAGNMGGAIVGGITSANHLNNHNVVIIDPFIKSFGNVKIEREINSDIATFDVVIIAVKPWIATQVMENVAQFISGRSDIVLCSVVAGITLEQMQVYFGSMPLFRIMPNTAASVGQSMTFISSVGAEQQIQEKITGIMQTMGQVMMVQQSQMDACMALSSCGIAYALRYIRAAIEGGIELGVPSSEAQKIICQTILGATALLEKGAHPEVEIDKVTTAGGITIKGLNAMEQAGFSSAVIQGLKASVNK